MSLDYHFSSPLNRAPATKKIYVQYIEAWGLFHKRLLVHNPNIVKFMLSLLDE